MFVIHNIYLFIVFIVWLVKFRKCKKVVTIGQDLRYRRYVYVQRVGDNMRIMIGVCSSGLIVFHHSVRLLSISWPRIVTLRCLRSHFNVKLRRLPDQVFTAHVACAFYTFVFTARRVCIARTMQWQDVCLSVCLTVCLSTTNGMTIL